VKPAVGKSARQHISSTICVDLVSEPMSKYENVIFIFYVRQIFAHCKGYKYTKSAYILIRVQIASNLIMKERPVEKFD
jgi:hypothetical protein